MSTPIATVAVPVPGFKIEVPSFTTTLPPSTTPISIPAFSIPVPTFNINVPVPSTTAPSLPTPPAGGIPASLSQPKPEDILRYRYQHGTNLGSIFVLERWLTGSMYIEGAPGDSELDAINSSLQQFGLPATRAKWEAHWASALTEDDLNWLTTVAHCNMIRLPIGWFTLGPAFCDNTAFAGDAAQVYVNAWTAVKDLVQRCHDHGVGVLIDFHAVPGGANTEIHSGTSSGKADLWGNTQNLAQAEKVLVHIASEANNMPGVIGVQLCNESVTGAASRGMYDWYGSVVAGINSVNATIPIYISDAWDIVPCLQFMKNMNPSTGTPLNPVIVDTHKYYTFSDFDKSQTPQQILDRIPSELHELDGQDGNVFDNGAASVFVGEYSCVMDPQTWSRVSEAEQPGLKKSFGIEQSQKWQAKSGGCSFWTYKMDWMDGGDWGFKQQSNDGAIVAPEVTGLGAQEVKNRFAKAIGKAVPLQNAALADHIKFWDKTSPGVQFEHARFGTGWYHGWNDAFSFFSGRVTGLIPGGNGGDKIGYLDLWVRKRMLESGNDKAHTKFGWEWEQGFRKGVVDYYSAVGI